MGFASADYTFLNERLARHYDIPNVYGDHFRKVDLDQLAKESESMDMEVC